MIETCVRGRLRLDIHWEEEQLQRIDLSWSSAEPEDKNLTAPGRMLALALDRFVRGEDPLWPKLPLAWDRRSPFARRVLSTLQETVPRGMTVSYGELARRCNAPGAARAVGAVMRANPWPLIVPCHRVIGSSGRLVGFGSGLEMKEYLLGLERVRTG
ncbi:MAG: methylated-DNA--[protein]-cysteine S-methyltransferase [Desulfovibrionales bacterium]